MADLLEDMARASFAVHAEAEPDRHLSWEKLPPNEKELFRRGVSAAMEVALSAMPGLAASIRGPGADRPEAVFVRALREAISSQGPGKPRRKVGPEDEERGQQSGDLPFNQRDD